VLALVLAGCGGKSDASRSTAPPASAKGTSSAAQTTPAPTTSTQAPAPTSSSKQFVAQADAICRKANARLARSKAKSRQPSDVAALIQGNQAIEQEAIGRLAKLGAPAELLPAWHKMLGYRRTLADQLGVYATAVGLGVKQLSSLAASKKKLHAELLKVGREAGFKDCAKIG
jgi:hypothetical protein